MLKKYDNHNYKLHAGMSKIVSNRIVPKICNIRGIGIDSS